LRMMAANILCDYLEDNVDGLADLLLDSDAAQYAKVFPLLAKSPERTLPLMSAALRTASAADPEKERVARRTANAAVTLLRLNRSDQVWHLFRHSPDPRVRSYLIHRVEPYEVDPLLIARRLEVETDVSAKRALLLTLGEFTSGSLDWRELLRPLLEFWFLSD